MYHNIELCLASGFNFAICEFANPKVIDLAQRYGLNVVRVKTRQAMNNQCEVTEIMLTNYTIEKPQQNLF